MKTIWNCCYNSNLHWVNIAYRWIGGTILNKPKMYPTGVLYNESGVFNIRQLFILEGLKFFHKHSILNTTTTTTHKTIKYYPSAWCITHWYQNLQRTTSLLSSDSTKIFWESNKKSDCTKATVDIQKTRLELQLQGSLRRFCSWAWV